MYLDVSIFKWLYSSDYCKYLCIQVCKFEKIYLISVNCHLNDWMASHDTEDRLGKFVLCWTFILSHTLDTWETSHYSINVLFWRDLSNGRILFNYRDISQMDVYDIIVESMSINRLNGNQNKSIKEALKVAPLKVP